MPWQKAGSIPRPIGADMVACDSCQMWCHYTCAKVEAEVKNREWYCSTCEPLAKELPPTRPVKLTVSEKDSKRSGKSTAGSKTSRKTKKTIGDKSVTSSVRARLALEMQVLEEQQRMQEEVLAAEKEIKDLQLQHEREVMEKERAFEARKLADEKAFLERKMAEELEYRKQQMAIKKQSLEDKAKLVRQISQCGSSRTSEISSVPDSRKRVEEWLEKSDRQTEGVAGACTSVVVPDANIERKLRATPEISALILRKSSDQHCENTHMFPIKSLHNTTQIGTVPDMTRQLADMDLNRSGADAVADARIGAANIRAQREFYLQNQSRNNREKNVLLTEPQVSRSLGSGSRQPVEEYDGPTNRQLAARQVMGKDLPPFSGRPEEWPLWYSNFQRSTTTCGFSDDENLIRLQRCLKGEALETVRSKLLCPSSVPHVIRTLEMRYGRPGTLIRVMTERIRLLPSPRTNDLNSIIEFGLAVDSLVEHLRNSGQGSHLNNPSLLHDLVTKLPVDHRLKWAAYKGSLHEPNLTAFGSFMSTMVELAYEVADDILPENSKQTSQQKPKERAFLHAHSESQVPNERAKKCCVVCNAEGHRIGDCSMFKQMGIDERYKVVQQNGLCRTCLNQHGRWPCKT
ncbi:uncharacterized protein LOC134288101 [Aedes albopictus]|uniref:PHD-type domain-containing protein n=1 Tax=Aedes albopictus TaxID=7160 RepID=A0ABM1ZX42_AEDAL